MKNIFYTDGQVFENRNPKDSYIAVIQEAHDEECMRQDERLISFISLGYQPLQETEGLGILQALRYIHLLDLEYSIIFTDSLTWSGIINGNHRIRGAKKKHEVLRNIAQEITQLKEEHGVHITWKRRNQNKAGKFLGQIWNKKKEYRENLIMDMYDSPIEQRINGYRATEIIVDEAVDAFSKMASDFGNTIDKSLFQPTKFQQETISKSKFQNWRSLWSERISMAIEVLHGTHDCSNNDY